MLPLPISTSTKTPNRRQLVEATGWRCMLMANDLGEESACVELVNNVMAAFGQTDILVDNAGEQHPQKSLEDIDARQLERTFRTNVFSMFFSDQGRPQAYERRRAHHQYRVSHCVSGQSETTRLLDYSATKGAIVAFTRSLSQALAERGILVNAVAPGPVWTPLIPSTFTAQEVASFGSKTPLGRAGQQDEIGRCYVFFASDDSTSMSGQVLHPNGGEVING